MPVTIRLAKIAAVVALGTVGLSACATKEYVDEQIAAVNTRIDQVDQRAGAASSAAASAAQQAQAAADAAGNDARTANQRVDQLTARVDAMEQRRVRSPRN